MKYVLNKAVFNRHLAAAGCASLVEFSRKSGIHRNTINNYLKGKDVFSTAFSSLAEELKISPLELIESVSQFDVRLDHIEEIGVLVARIVKVDDKIAVVLLGSRPKNSAKKYSDWDIGVTRGSVPLTSREYLALKQIADDAADDLPRKVDIVSLDLAPEWFLQQIDYEPIFLSGNEIAYNYFKGVLYGLKRIAETA
jgi:predicted nucleotidyltransferase